VAKEVWPGLFLGGPGDVYAALGTLQSGGHAATTFACQACRSSQRERGGCAKLVELHVLCYRFHMNDDATYRLEHAEEIVELMTYVWSSIGRSTARLVRACVRVRLGR